jgi:hypothetical protein
MHSVSILQGFSFMLKQVLRIESIVPKGPITCINLYQYEFYYLSFRIYHICVFLLFWSYPMAMLNET